MEYERPAYRPHSALMLRAQITLPHFSVSSAISLIKSADEPASAVPPSSASRVLILGSGRAAARSTFGRRRMARGRLAMRQSGPETMLPRWLGDCYEKKSAAAASGIVCIRTGRAGVSGLPQPSSAPPLRPPLGGGATCTGALSSVVKMAHARGNVGAPRLIGGEKPQLKQFMKYG